ncbi:hypothetical protein SAY86_014763 [Trapa natans]|uniref:TF-B3 domain-containing protein n=1 Tax=Trapa natans TaxID=22666 RepID=A0AAN7QGA1_TRANT|nr:hypothetical protein SAY86_014763 [Trapa natans]
MPPKPSLYSLRELSSEFHRVIQRFHDVELKLIMEKALTGSDMNRGLGRISLPSSNVVTDFLRPEERHCLENREDIPVLVISPSLDVFGLSLKSWKISSSLVHVLTGGWNIIAHDPKNGLQENEIVQVWAFWTGESLGMAIVKANVGEEGADDGESPPNLSPRGVLLSSRKYDSSASTSFGD